MPKIVDHEKYRGELLDICFGLFAEKGFSNVTMREIAKGAGISTGALYHYFPNKYSILEQLFFYVGEKDVAEAVKRTSVSGSFEERMEIFFHYILEKESYFQNMLLLSIDFVRNYDSSLSERIVYQWAHYYVQNMRHYLEVPPAIAQTILTYFIGMVYQSKLFPKMVSSVEMAHLFREILVGYLSKHHDPKNRLCRMCPFMPDRIQTASQQSKGTF